MRKGISSTILASMTAAALLLTGCVKDAVETDALPSDTAKVTLKIDTGIDFMEVMTKSSYSPNETKVNDVNLVIYDASGNYVDNFYGNPSQFNISVTAGQTYTFYALVNYGKAITPPDSEDDLVSGVYPFSGSSIGSNGIPMAGSLSKAVSGNTSIVIPVKRLFAKIGVSYSGMNQMTSSFEFSSVTMKQCPTHISPWTENYRETSSSEDGDSASSSDLYSLNLGGEIFFYVPENCGGTVSSITSPEDKIPGNVSGSGHMPYLEMVADYSNQGLTSSDVTLRFYPGMNNTSDFNVYRNHVYHITVMPCDDSVLEPYWKVDWEDMNNGREIWWEPESITITGGSSADAEAMTTPVDLDITFTESNPDAWDDAGAWWEQDSNVITVYSTYAGTSPITLQMIAEAGINGTVGYASATLPIVLNNTISHKLVVSPTSASIKVGETASLKATYYTITNGVSDSGKDVTSSATWTSSSTSIATVSGGTVTGKSAGSSTVTATYGGIKTTCAVTVTGKTLVGLTLSDRELQMYVGDEMWFQVTAEYSDGTSEIVTEDCDVENDSEEYENYFRLENDREEMWVYADAPTDCYTLTMSYTYGGTTLTADIDITIAEEVTYTYKMVLSPTSSTVNVGDKVTFTLKRQTYANGVLQSTADVTSLAQWNSSVTSSVTMSSNVATAVKAGTSTITATYVYGGVTYRATATVKVTAVTVKKTVVSVTGSWKVTDLSYGTEVMVNGTNAVNMTVTNTITESGDTLLEMIAFTNGHDETTFNLVETITYKLSDGTTHTYSTYSGYWGMMPLDDSDDELVISGDDIETFTFHYIIIGR